MKQYDPSFGIHLESPVRRYGHAAVCLGYGTSSPQILATGGRDSRGRILNDTWILDIQSQKWTEVRTFPLVLQA